MTSQKSTTKTITKIVVVFDICSSTTILDQLLISDQQRKWRNLLIGLKKFITANSSNLGFEIYKFVGDGWILLFPEDFDGNVLFDFLNGLCRKYNSLYGRVEDVLSNSIDNTGLTIGIDKGTMIHMVMNGKREYIGRPINIATRLQGSIRDGVSVSHNKVLISRNTYNNFSEDQRDVLELLYDVTDTSKTLRNVLTGKNFKCKEITF